MEPALSDIRYFLEVARVLNISRAAERLMIRQSSLSAAIKRLEEALGVELLFRGKTGVKLTKAGERFVAASHELVEKWEELRGSTRNAITEVEGYYTLGCHPNPSRYLLPMFLPELQKNHPRLEIQLVHDRSQTLNEMVISSRLDFAIVAHVVPNPDLVAVPLVKEQTGIWVRNDVVLDREATTLMFDPGVRQQLELLELLERKNLRFRRTATCPSVEVLWALAEAGYAAVMMPNSPVLYSRSREVLRLATELPMVPSELALIFRVETQRSAAAKTIVRTIRERCSAARPT